MGAGSGSLFGSGKGNDDAAGRLRKGDKLTVVLRADGAVLFGLNGRKHGPGWPAGSVRDGAVVPAAHMYYNDRDGANAVRLLPDAAWPAGHGP